MHTNLLALLLFAAAAISSGAAADDGVVSYSIPAFDTTTTVQLLGTTNSSVYSFQPGDGMGQLQRTEGFLLLAQRVGIWRTGAGEEPALEASFNTNFTYSGRGVKPIAFVVLLDSIPPVGGSLRGEGNYTASMSSSDGIAAVEVGPVMSYSRHFYPDVGLNVTVTPRRSAPALALWIEYDAGKHYLSVYVAAASKMKPSKALLELPLDLVAERRTAETAYIGFFAATVRDIVVGVRYWNLTVDKFPGNEDSVANGKKVTPWLVVLLAVVGSMAATSVI